MKVLADATAPRIWSAIPANWIRFPDTLGSTVPLYLAHREKPYWFEHLPAEKTVFFQWNNVRSVKEEPFEAFTERLKKFIGENDVERLVIDLRWNNGGNSVIGRTFVDALRYDTKINVRGKLFVIIGRRTYSAAQNVATWLEQETNSIFVGEPSGSSPNFIGEEDFVRLP